MMRVLLPAIFAASMALPIAAAGSERIVEKGALMLSDDFTTLPADQKVHDFGEGWQRRISFGKWTALKPGSVSGVNIPAQGHGPVLTYLGPVGDVIIECEFRLPKKEGPDRHFRIFLDHPDYRGHTIAAWANLSTVFQPKGLTLLHNPKTGEKTVLEEVRFGPEKLEPVPGVWHKMRVELVGKRARVSVGDQEVSGLHASLNVTKNKIGLNPGKAGGDLRNFRVWKIKPAKE